MEDKLNLTISQYRMSKKLVLLSGFVDAAYQNLWESSEVERNFVETGTKAAVILSEWTIGGRRSY